MNTVTLSNGAVGNVTSATATQLVVNLTTPPTTIGSLTAVVTSFGGTSGSAVQVANIVAAPIVTLNTNSLAINATTLTIAGTGFDTVGSNTVTFNNGAVGNVTSATATQLIVNLTTPPTIIGSLTAVVTSFGGTSGSAIQVANIVAAPTVTLSTNSLAINATTLTIAGTGFDTTAANNTVTLNNGAVGNVTSATATQLIVNLTIPPTTIGSLTAVVTSFGGTSGIAVQVANIVAAPTVTLNTNSLAINATTLTIAGTGFDTVGSNTVTFNNGAVGNVTSATATQLVVNLTTPPTTIGSLTAVVTSFGGTSGIAVQVANIIAAPTVTLNTNSLAINATTLTIAGTGFDTVGSNTVTLSSGTGTVTSATATQLIVTFNTAPSLGNLTAVVTSFEGTSGNPVQVATILNAANTPVFGAPTSTADGFTVQISNYDPNFTYGGTATANGAVAISSTGLVTVTGVAANTSSTATITTTRNNHLTGSGQVTATSLAPTAPLVVGTPASTSSGGSSTVTLYDPVTGAEAGTAVPFPGFSGPVKVVSGDFNGDGVAELIAGAGFGGGPAIAVLNSQTGEVMEAFFAFDQAFTGGVFVAVQDVNNDGILDIIASAGPGGGPEVRIFDGNGLTVLRSFYAYAVDFTGGVSVASIDFNNDGILDLVTGAGPGGAPHVKVFDGATNAIISQWYAYATDFTGGVFAAVGDIGNDGAFEVVTGAGAGGSPVVAVWDPNTGALLAQFMAYAEDFTGGVRVGINDGNTDGIADILTGAGPGGGPQVNVFNFPALDLLFSFYSGDPTNTGGVFVS
jgi:stress response protein SCP2